MDITIGRMVHYTVSEQDVEQIMRQRTAGKSIAERMMVQVHVGAVYPAMSVSVWSPSSANVQVFLDGNDVFWATSRSEGTEPGTWAWPPRVG